MLLVDSHVHIYDCFDLQIFLDSALANFKSVASHCGQSDNFQAILLLAETTSENWFHRLAGYAREGKGITNKGFKNWTFHPTNETHSLCARCNGGQSLYLIAGRQIATVEDLEVLALITGAQFEDGHPLEEVIWAVKKCGGIPVLPWGFGKWTGNRGRVLRRVLENARDSGLFLGDNGGRPIFWPHPTEFKIAEENKIWILPGSDPLPFQSELRRAGSYGFWVEGSITDREPAGYIKRILLDPMAQLHAYGRHQSPYQFCRNQLRIQIKKRMRLGNRSNQPKYL